MSIKRSVALIAALALASTLSLTACSSGGNAAGGKTELTVMWASNELDKTQIADFEKKNPDISIKFIEYDESRFNAMVTAGDPPDVVRGSPSANVFKRGLATALDDYIAKSDVIKADDLLPANDAWKWDGTTRGTGKTYGIIKDFSPDTTLWQNTALLEKAGVEPLSTTEPTNWDDVLESAKKLKSAGVQYPLGIEWQWGVASTITAMVAQQDASLFNKDLTKVDYTSPEAQRALQWLADYGTSGAGPTSLNPLSAGQDAPAYTGGTMALTMDGYWFGGNLQADDAKTVAATSELVPSPTFGKQVSMMFGGVGGWIPEASKNKDAAWKFLEWYCGGQPAIDRAKTGYGLPILKSLWKDLPSETEYQKQALKVAQTEAESVIPGTDSPYATFGQINPIVDKELQKVIQGKQTTEQAGKTITSQVNKVLAEGKAQLG